MKEAANRPVRPIEASSPLRIVNPLPIKTISKLVRIKSLCDREGNQGCVGKEGSKASPAEDGEAEIRKGRQNVMSINLSVVIMRHQAWTISLHMS